MTAKKWIVDMRVGYVVVYQGPRRDCLYGIRDAAYFERGRRTGLTWTWPSLEETRDRACVVAAILNQKEAELEAKEAEIKVKVIDLQHVKSIFYHLAEREYRPLATINEMYQADVDTVVARDKTKDAEIRELKVHVVDLRETIADLKKG